MKGGKTKEETFTVFEQNKKETLTTVKKNSVPWEFFSVKTTQTSTLIWLVERGTMTIEDKTIGSNSVNEDK